MTFRSGVRPWKYDPREKGFSLRKYYGAPNLAIIPKGGLLRPRRPIENQGNTLRCGAYSSAVSNGYLRNARFHPDYQAKKIGQRQGKNVDDFGSEPRAIMDTMCKDGSALYELFPLHLETHGIEATRDWNAYPETLDSAAQSFRIKAYLGCDTPGDYFDDVRWALFNAYDPITKTGAVVHAFSMWYQEWTYAAGGVIPLGYQMRSGWHTYLFVDWTVIDGIEYLIAQNSYGNDAGHNGYYYFPREVVNREFAKWNTALKIPTGILTAEQVALAKQENPWGRLQRLIIDAWFALSQKYGNLIFN